MRPLRALAIKTTVDTSCCSSGAGMDTMVNGCAVSGASPGKRTKDVLTGPPSHGRVNGDLGEAAGKSLDAAPGKGEEAVLAQLHGEAQEDGQHVHGCRGPQIPPRGEHGLAVHKHVAEKDDGHRHVDEQEELVAPLANGSHARKREHKETGICDDARGVDAVEKNVSRRPSTPPSAKVGG